MPSRRSLRERGRCSCCTTSRGTAMRRSPSSPASPWERPRRSCSGRAALAAAAVRVIALGLYRLLPPSTAPYRPAGQGWAAVQADFDRATNELSLILAAQRGRLRPETVALVERNLGIIDAAIAESRAALARDTANAELQHLWAAAARQKVELLRWATRVAAS